MVSVPIGAPTCRPADRRLVRRPAPGHLKTKEPPEGKTYQVPRAASGGSSTGIYGLRSRARTNSPFMLQDVCRACGKLPDFKAGANKRERPCRPAHSTIRRPWRQPRWFRRHAMREKKGPNQSGGKRNWPQATRAGPTQSDWVDEGWIHRRDKGYCDPATHS